MTRRITKSLLLTLAAVLLLAPCAASAATITTHSDEGYGELDIGLRVEGHTYHWSHLNYHLRKCRSGRPTCDWMLLAVESSGRGCPAAHSTYGAFLWEPKFFRAETYESLSLKAGPGYAAAHPGPDGSNELCWYVQFEREPTSPLVATTKIRP